MHKFPTVRPADSYKKPTVGLKNVCKCHTLGTRQKVCFQLCKNRAQKLAFWIRWITTYQWKRTALQCRNQTENNYGRMVCTFVRTPAQQKNLSRLYGRSEPTHHTTLPLHTREAVEQIARCNFSGIWCLPREECLLIAKNWLKNTYFLHKVIWRKN